MLQIHTDYGRREFNRIKENETAAEIDEAKLMERLQNTEVGRRIQKEDEEFLRQPNANHRDLMKKKGRVWSPYYDDLNFLNAYVWPLVEGKQIGHDAYSCTHWPNSRSFPTKRPDDYQHVG